MCSSTIRSPIHGAAMSNLNTFGRVVVVGTIALADGFDQPDIGLGHFRKTLITRARIQDSCSNHEGRVSIGAFRSAGVA